MKKGSPRRIIGAHDEGGPAVSTRQSSVAMASPESLRVVRGHTAQLVRGRVEPAPVAKADGFRPRISRAQTVLVCGHTLVDNAWLVGRLEAHAYQVTRHASLKEVPSLLDRDPDAIALIEAAPPRQADALELVRRLDPRYRRRSMLVIWRPARGVVHEFIEAGIGDFFTLPAPASEILLRLELRARDARMLVFAQRPEWYALLPEVNRVNGSIGPESGGIRLTEREFLLYDILAQQFGNVVPRAEILGRIWGHGLGDKPSSNIVDVYVRYLRVKLAKVAPSLIITTARGVGYVLDQRGE